MQIVIDIEEQSGSLNIGFSKEYTGNPIEDLERVKLALLLNKQPKSSIIKPSAKAVHKLVGVK